MSFLKLVGLQLGPRRLPLKIIQRFRTGPL